MGDGTAAKARDLFVRFRVSAAERKALDLMLCQEDRAVSEFLRDLVRQEAIRRNLWPLPDRTLPPLSERLN